MSRHGNNGAMTALAAATALTSWVALWPWSGFAESGGRYLIPLLLGIALISAVGMLCRLARFPLAVVLSSQLLTVMLIGNAIWGSRLTPTPGSLEAAVERFGRAVDTAQKWAAPVPESAPTIAPIMILGGLMIHVFVDFLGVTMLRVPAAGLPLLAAYSLPISVLEKQVSWLVFALAATGFLAMLALQENDRVTRWGRALVADEDVGRSGFSLRARQTHPAALGGWAIVAALFLPLAIPTLDLSGFGEGDGSGGGGGDRTVSIQNPMTDMKRDLQQPEDTPALRVITPDPAPSYLRIAVLTEFGQNAWIPGGRDLDEDQSAEGELPLPAGLGGSVARIEVPWELEYQKEFTSLWLPAPMFLAAIDAGDEWGYDPETLDFHTYDEDADTRGTSYAVTALDVDIQPQLLASAPRAPSDLHARYTSVPADLPPMVADLADEVTKDAETAYDQAVALQQWFRTEFTYSLDQDPGTGTDDLVEFLAPEGREGYCEQFASSMAAMARTLDIPARVAVGFLEADPVDGEDDVWMFSTRDLHAWPELYFEGVGWVMFEPTPSIRAGSVPSYTSEAGSNGGPTAPPSGPGATSPTADPTRLIEPAPEGEVDDAGTTDDDSWLPWLSAGGLLLVLVAVAALPRAIRRRRTVTRWATATDPAEAAWNELRDAAVDLGVAWPAGRSPRAAGRLLADSFAAPLTKDAPVRPAHGAATNPEARAALDRIVAAVERSRYAPPGASAAAETDLRAATGTCIEALRAGVTTSARRRAEWLPASLRRRRGVGGNGQPATRPRPRQGVFDSLG